MGKRYEMLRRCGQIRNLVEDNKYTKALEQIEELSLSDVNSVDDLYLFADMYEKAERFDREKEIFYIIYERTNSRLALRRLLRLVIRMGEMEEARELFLAYEVLAGVTLDTFELRYLLARAEGQPRSRLIEILEDLKKEEYTEEWGLQLARLYEQEGLREKCIQECKDLKLWFGEGSIVEKAQELLARCESDDWEPPVDEEIPEPELPDREEIFAYAAPPVEIEAMPEAGEASEAEEPETAQAHETVRPVQTEKPAEELDDLLQEEAEDISERGIRYYTLKGVITRIKHSQEIAHFVFAGGEERITLAVAKRIAKELNHVGYFSARSIVKITADKLNQLELAERIEKILGGCMLVTNASELNKKSVEDLVSAIDENGDKMVVMLCGPFDEMDCFLGIYPELSEKMNYKIRM